MQQKNHGTGRRLFGESSFSEGKWWYPWDGGPLIINPIATLYSGNLLGISLLKGLQQGGLNS